MSPEPTWFLLYGGTSVDGRGPGTYQGRTTDAALARRHYEQCRRDPYSCGYVMAATDQACWRLVMDGCWEGT